MLKTQFVGCFPRFHATHSSSRTTSMVRINLLAAPVERERHERGLSTNERHRGPLPPQQMVNLVEIKAPSELMMNVLLHSQSEPLLKARHQHTGRHTARSRRAGPCNRIDRKNFYGATSVGVLSAASYVHHQSQHLSCGVGQSIHHEESPRALVPPSHHQHVDQPPANTTCTNPKSSQVESSQVHESSQARRSTTSKPATGLRLPTTRTSCGGSCAAAWSAPAPCHADALVVPKPLSCRSSQGTGQSLGLHTRRRHLAGSAGLHPHPHPHPADAARTGGASNCRRGCRHCRQAC